MSRIALVEPQSLLGQSLREALEPEPTVSLELFGLDEEEFGTLTDVGDEVSLVQPLSPEGLTGSDLVLICGSGPQQRRAVELLPETTPAIVVASDFEHPPGDLRLSGLGGGDSAARVVVSPHPVVVLLARLLDAVRELDPVRLSGTIILPASMHGAAALDELFEQTRSILAFSDERPDAIFGRQLAFNLLPGPAADTAGTQVRQLLSADVEVGIDLVQGPVFHGLTASLVLEVASGADALAVETSLDASEHIEVVEADSLLGPIDTAGRDEILATPARADADRPDAVWIWAAMDNLTAGGATNVVGLLRESALWPADA